MVKRKQLLKFADENLNHLVIDCNLRIVKLLALSYYINVDLPTHDWEVLTIEGEISTTCVEDIIPLKDFPQYERILENFNATIALSKMKLWI